MHLSHNYHDMKAFLFFTLIFSLLFISCSKEEDDMIVPIKEGYTLNFDTINIAPSESNWVLFSWYEASSWNFSLIAGEDNNKSFKNVITSSYKVTGTEQLLQLLAKLPEEETVIMCCGNSLEGLSDTGEQIALDLPPNDILVQLQDYSVQINIIFFIDKNMAE